MLLCACTCACMRTLHWSHSPVFFSHSEFVLAFLRCDMDARTAGAVAKALCDTINHLAATILGESAYQHPVSMFISSTNFRPSHALASSLQVQLTATPSGRRAAAHIGFGGHLDKERVGHLGHDNARRRGRLRLRSGAVWCVADY